MKTIYFIILTLIISNVEVWAQSTIYLIGTSKNIEPDQRGYYDGFGRFDGGGLVDLHDRPSISFAIGSASRRFEFNLNNISYSQGAYQEYKNRDKRADEAPGIIYLPQSDLEDLNVIDVHTFFRQ